MSQGKLALSRTRLNMSFWALLGAASLGCALTGLFSTPTPVPTPTPIPTPTPDPAQAVLQTIYDNIDAANQEDIDAYMETIHPDSPAFVNTRQILVSVNDQYDLHYELIDAEVTDISGSKAEVTFTLETTKISGPDFKDNRIKGVMFLRKDGDKWKIFNQVVDDIEYLSP